MKSVTLGNIKFILRYCRGIWVKELETATKHEVSQNYCSIYVGPYLSL
jgi:hypothetical protein